MKNNFHLIVEKLDEDYEQHTTNFDIAKSKTGLFRVQSTNKWMDQASKRPIPKRLFGDFWFESEISILFADTNVGKSTILNLLGKEKVFAENKLFATLDTTVRKIVFQNIPFLLADTVGFIRKLPHQLVESFKSTLDEVREADLLLHVVDISHPAFEDHYNTVNETLKEIEALDKPVILVFNKIDAFTYVKKDEDDLTPVLRENISLDELKNSWMNRMEEENIIFISAQDKMNIEELREKMAALVQGRVQNKE